MTGGGHEDGTPGQEEHLWIIAAGTGERPWRTPPTPPLSRIRRALHLVGWNTLLLMAVLALIGLAGEAWFRLTTPFTGKHFPKDFVRRRLVHFSSRARATRVAKSTIVF